MSIEQNIRTHTRITHDKFRRNKIQNNRLAVIFNCFSSLSRKFCIIAKADNITKTKKTLRKFIDLFQINFRTTLTSYRPFCIEMRIISHCLLLYGLFPPPTFLFLQVIHNMPMRVSSYVMTHRYAKHNGLEHEYTVRRHAPPFL